VQICVCMCVCVRVCVDVCDCKHSCELYECTHLIILVCADVSISLRIVRSPVEVFSEYDWERLGLREHICEIQLLLKSYAQEKISSTHEAYIRYRNVMAQ